MPSLKILRFIAIVAVAWISCPGPLAANPNENRPYDAQLLRLSEILGSIHYLRELCGAKEGQYWREEMERLIDSEGSTSARRIKLVRGFNKGYRSYRRTYRSCTPSARTVIERFLGEGAELAEKIVASN